MVFERTVWRFRKPKTTNVDQSRNASILLCTQFLTFGFTMHMAQHFERRMFGEESHRSLSPPRIDFAQHSIRRADFVPKFVISVRPVSWCSCQSRLRLLFQGFLGFYKHRSYMHSLKIIHAKHSDMTTTITILVEHRVSAQRQRQYLWNSNNANCNLRAMRPRHRLQPGLLRPLRRALSHHPSCRPGTAKAHR